VPLVGRGAGARRGLPLGALPLPAAVGGGPPARGVARPCRAVRRWRAGVRAASAGRRRRG